MGAGITVAQGLHRVEPETAHFAFIGDSTFFHSGITGVINAVYNQTDVIVVILDNSTTAMTGNQPHPGTGVTMMGGMPEKLSIDKLLLAAGVSALRHVNPFDQDAARQAVREMLDTMGVRAIVFDAPCAMLSRAAADGRAAAAVDATLCVGCKLCAAKLGCPAISLARAPIQAHDRRGDDDGIGLTRAPIQAPAPDAPGDRPDRTVAYIDPALCNGCGLCAYVCPRRAIRTHGEEHACGGTASAGEAVSTDGRVHAGGSDAERAGIDAAPAYYHERAGIDAAPTDYREHAGSAAPAGGATPSGAARRESEADI